MHFFLFGRSVLKRERESERGREREREEKKCY